MSVCTTGTCPHGRGVFIWVADGPWLEDEADPNYGGWPWVHDTTMTPSHLVICDLKPFANTEEAGELCACGHSSHLHDSAPGMPLVGMSTKPRHCPCGCPDFDHRPEDLARWRKDGTTSATRFRPGETEPRPADDNEKAALLSEGHAVPGGPGACTREGCAHLTLWHGANGKFKGRPCVKCPCPAFTREAGQVMPLVQGSLFDEAFA